MNRLFVTELKSIGLVSEGDNPDAEVVIFKAKLPRMEKDKALGIKIKRAREARDMSLDEVAARLPITGSTLGQIERGDIDDPPDDVRTAIGRTLGINVSKMTGKAESLPKPQKVNMDLSAIEDDQLRKSIEDEFAEKDTEVSDLETNLKSVIDKVAELEKGDSKPEDDASDEVKVLIKERDDQIAGLRKDLDDSVTKARIAEYVVKAEPLQGLLGKPDEVGVVFADLAVKAPDSFAKLEGMLNAAAQRDDLAKLFATLGPGDGEGEEDPIAKREVWVEKNRKDDETVTQARGRYWTEHPDAVKDSRS